MKVRVPPHSLCFLARASSASARSLASAAASTLRRGLVAAAMASVLGGCSGDDIASARPGSDASATADSTTNDATHSDADGSAETGPTLCAQLGGWAAVQTLVGEAAGVITTDCRIGAFFDPKRGGRVTYSADHIGQCLQKYFGAAASCVDASGSAVRYDHDSAGIACRDMYVSHKGLGLSDADFAAFVEDLVKAFDARGLTDAQKTALVSSVQSAFVQVVESPAAGNSKASCDAGVDVGTDASATEAAVADSDGPPG
jgi:hypothetical protein